MEVFSTRKCLVGALVVVAFGTVSPRTAFACHGPAGNFVWHDFNHNGLQDAGEPGIPNVRLTISPTTDNGQTEAFTSADGYYQFDYVVCNYPYTVAVDSSSLPAGYSVTSIGVGSNRAIDSNDPAGTQVMVLYDFTLDPPQPPQPDFTADFGYVTACTGAIGDRVWIDANHDGIQDPGETGVAGASVSLNGGAPVATGAAGDYLFSGLCAGSYQVCVAVPPGYEATAANQGANDAVDSDGSSDGQGNSCATVALGNDETNRTIDFGFFQTPQQPGTGTPGYWRNHPDAWPAPSITIGGVVYTRSQAIAWIDSPDGDKTVTMFRSLVAAKLNVLIGNDASCVASTIAAADAWMATYGPVGSGVRASSTAWKIGEPLYRLLDNYNNGMLCAPARE